MEIKAPPKMKVVLVTDSIDELNKLITEERWQIASTFTHAQGAIFLLAKD